VSRAATRALSLEVKLPGLEADHSLPSSAEVNMLDCTSTPLYVILAWSLSTGIVLPLLTYSMVDII
jgi:hypothetical protein